jgi:hypothetical protein
MPCVLCTATPRFLVGARRFSSSQSACGFHKPSPRHCPRNRPSPLECGPPLSPALRKGLLAVHRRANESASKLARSKRQPVGRRAALQRFDRPNRIHTKDSAALPSTYLQVIPALSLEPYLSAKSRLSFGHAAPHRRSVLLELRGSRFGCLRRDPLLVNERAVRKCFLSSFVEAVTSF